MNALWLCLLLLWPGLAWAIVNLEGLHLQDPPPGWSGALDGALSGNAGNTRTLSVDLGVRLQWRDARLTRFLVSDYGYSESRGVRARDRRFLHLREIRHGRGGWAREGYLQAESDAFARLRLRALAGAGLRHVLREGDGARAFLGLGAFYSRERIADGRQGEDLDYGQWRANLYLIARHSPGSGRRLWLTLYAQPDLTALDDLRLLASAGAAMDLGRGWSVHWRLHLTYDTLPPLAVRRYDLSYRAGLGYRF